MKSDEPKIWITVSETVNMGPYESVKVEAGYSKPYNKESPQDLIDSEIDELRKIVKKKAKKIRKNKL